MSERTHKNECHLHGVLAKDPIIRFTATGKQVATLTVITKFRDTSEFHRVVAWEALAQKVETLHKGDFVQIVGRLQTRNWEDAAKVKHYSTEIVAFQLVVPAQEQEPASGGKAAAQAILRPSPAPTHGGVGHDDRQSF
jgi:single-strand DNA-binding protein